MPLWFYRWWLGPDSTVMLDVRCGERRLKIKPKKATVEVGATENLVPTLTLLKEAVDAGELDQAPLAAREEWVGLFRRSGADRGAGTRRGGWGPYVLCRRLTPEQP